MGHLTEIGNQIEAVLWFVFAAVFGVAAMRTTARTRRLWRILCLAFAAFGVSDLIEAHTGAWWRPTWLLALKGACLGVFAWAIVEYRRIRPRRQA